MNIPENEGEIQFSELLQQIEACLQTELYFVAIMASLVIPDIGGAIDSENGEATKEKYIAWFDKYVKPRYPAKTSLTGDECYYLRCSMLHQGKTSHSKIKIVFMHYPQSNAPVNPTPIQSNQGLLVEPHTFCRNMISAAYNWLEVAHNNYRFKKNLKNFMTLYSLTFVDEQGKTREHCT